MRRAILALLLVGCTAGPTAPVGTDPDEGGGSGGEQGSGMGTPPLPDVQCATDPDAGASGDFHHLSSKLIAALGSPKHRGYDLIADADAATQTIAGAISYTLADKALEDEDVEVFACRAGAWQKLGSARTDSEGGFSLALSAGDRLPLGMRDMFVSVVGDRTGARFLAYVAPPAEKLLVSDVDGTLTTTENGFFKTITLGQDVDAHPGAPQAYGDAAMRTYQPVYVTARGQQYTQETRDWLTRKGFPRGPLRLSPSFVTLPGGDTVDYKTQTLQAISATGLAIEVGVGNRASDITAYTSAGVAPDRIFIKLPEYTDEVKADLDAGHAIGFMTYDDLRTQRIDQLP